MKIGYTIIFTIFSILPKAYSQLPPVSEEIVQKFDKWEAEKRAALEEEVHQKRNQVIVLLERQLSEVTKSGNLNGALSIKKQIDQLKSLKGTELSASPPVWVFHAWSLFYDQINHGHFIIERGGKAIHKNPAGKKANGSWKYKGEEVVIDWGKGYTHRIKIPFIRNDTLTSISSDKKRKKWTLRR